MRFFIGLLLYISFTSSWAQEVPPRGSTDSPHTPSKFRNLDDIWPTPNLNRTASGSPGPAYWQNRCDYVIKATLDETKPAIRGDETITYHNLSPLTLQYIWVQLDQNLYDKNSDTHYGETFSSWLGNYLGAGSDKANLNQAEVNDVLNPHYFNGGYVISDVKAKDGKPLSTFINKTMMRVDLPTPLEPGKSYTFSLKWSFNIPDYLKFDTRSGYEYFPEDGNYLFEIAQWFPRVCNYNDVKGWQTKPYLGRGEFNLPFGNYTVELTVPADHVVGATGELQNATEVLSKEQIARLEQARKTEDKPVLIVSEDEARKAEKNKAKNTKTWKYVAKDVRDFAFASSRKFIWDAMGTRVGGNTVLAMSLYPKEGNPLWGEYSTRVVAHTLKEYSKYSIPYPYPVCISVHGPVWGMEYPMICFNGGRPEIPGKPASDRIKWAMIGVIIHEVGHNFFPMVINNDEREHPFMDEGFNSFIEYLAEQSWDKNFPSRRGPVVKLKNFLAENPHRQQPIVTNPEYQPAIGNVIYGKTAAALYVLRETILGPEVFDAAFKAYCSKWAFKNPYPPDFFRSMEEYTGTDLDWFWRGWFYSTDYLDLSLDKVETWVFAESAGQIPADLPTGFTYKHIPRDKWKSFIDQLPVEERPKDGSTPPYIYVPEITNKGGLLSPILLRLTYMDGSTENIRLPVYVWRLNDKLVRKPIVTQKPVRRIEIDPTEITGDVKTDNNSFPR